MSSPVLTKSPKSQLTAEQPLTKSKNKNENNTGTYQKVFPTPKDKEETTTSW